MKDTIRNIYKASEKNYHLIEPELDGLTTEEVFLSGMREALTIVYMLHLLEKGNEL